MAFYYYLALLAVLSTPVWSYSSGAPPSACDILGPKHRDDAGKQIQSRSDPAPYKFTLSENTANALQPFEVQLSSTGGQDIQGFLIQAQLNGKAVGSFSAEPSNQHAQVTKCSGEGDSLTHTKIKDSKVKAVNFHWIPSADLKGKSVTLVGTVAEGYNKFWVKGVTAKIQVA